MQTLQEAGFAQAQRYAPCADLGFTDEGLVTIYLFAVASEQKRQAKDIHRHAGRYWRDGFPRLPGYGAYVQRLNRIADCFPALLERFCETRGAASLAGLVDSMPVLLARQGHRFNAKAAPELAGGGYCPAKNLHYYGVKIHLVGDFRHGTLPLPRFTGLNWVEEKTGIEIASKVRSYRGLLVHVFGRLAAAMFLRNVLPQSP